MRLIYLCWSNDPTQQDYQKTPAAHHDRMIWH
jgi:hypothetical protein